MLYILCYIQQACKQLESWFWKNITYSSVFYSRHTHMNYIVCKWYTNDMVCHVPYTFRCNILARRRDAGRNIRVVFRSQEHFWRINETFANAAPISSFDSFAFHYARGISSWICKKHNILTQFCGHKRCRVWIYYTYAQGYYGYCNTTGKIFDIATLFYIICLIDCMTSVDLFMDSAWSIMLL